MRSSSPVAGLSKPRGKQLEQAFRSSGPAASDSIDFDTVFLDGEPTVAKADAFAAQARNAGADFIVGLGGGKVLDLSKAVAQRLSLPLATIPTIAATCAAWTSVYLLYTDDHKVDQHEWLDDAPELVLVDKSVILATPERYLFSGVGDALAKWVEECHPTDRIDESQIDLWYRLRRRIGSLTRDSLEIEFLDAHIDASASSDPALNAEAVNAIIVLAGLPVGFRPSAPVKAAPRLELAHAVYNSWTWLGTGAELLHGEVVAFGVAVQRALQGADEADVKSYLRRISGIGLPVSLAQLGVTDDGQIRQLADYVANGLPGYSKGFPTVEPEDVEQALRTVDALGKTA